MAPKIEAYRRPPLHVDGREVFRLQEGYWVRVFPHLKVPKESLGKDNVFIVLEKQNEGRDASWWKVQLLQKAATDSGPAGENFDSNARGWPIEVSDEITTWIGDGAYHIYADSESFQAQEAPLKLASVGDTLEIRLESTWRTGTGEYGLALFSPGDPISRRFSFFYVTQSGEAGVWTNGRSEPVRQVYTRFRPTGSDTIQSVVLRSRSVTYSVGNVVVYESGDFDLKNLRQIALVVRGKQVVSFRDLSIRSGVERDEAEPGPAPR